ncbi:MAG: hypothetical protein M1822_000066 [Bathelium mastoideum]|nr:MAG: hypothetical protein M1822_000066 [Bathelium mastoideum]
MSGTSVPHEPTDSEHSSSLTKPVIGIYGISGSGKSYLKQQVEQELHEENFAFYEGSAIIEQLVSGGLGSFKNLEKKEQDDIRGQAITKIQKECAERGKAGVVVGHHTLWSEGETKQVVWTESDQKVFTHIIYLATPPYVVNVRRRGDKSKTREEVSVEHLTKWAEAEEAELRRICYSNGILFSRFSAGPAGPDPSKVLLLLRDFKQHSEETNMLRASAALDTILSARKSQLTNLLVIDGDKTLAPEDASALVWNAISLHRLDWRDQWNPTNVFQSPLGYSYKAFRQTSLLSEATIDDTGFDVCCGTAAKQVKVYPEFASLVIGGGRMSDGFVVTADVKAALTARMRHTYHFKVWAFGDSPLDLDMLREAHVPIVVVGQEHTRSKSMEAELEKAIQQHGLEVRQALLPSTVTPRLNITKVPPIQLTDPTFIESIFGPGIELLDASTKNAAKLLAAPMRNANVAGPALREKHRQSGWYLANEFISEVICIEEYNIEHVQGGSVMGYRLLDEKKTTIVALMRGGEPMALGVNDAFPSASLIHAKFPNDIKDQHLKGMSSVILVDSVINTGKTLVEFIERVLDINAALRIVTVAGVVQVGSISGDGPLALLARKKHLILVALRLSENKFKGKGATDTGNRLFNTTFLD